MNSPGPLFSTSGTAVRFGIGSGIIHAVLILTSFFLFSPEAAHAQEDAEETTLLRRTLNGLDLPQRRIESFLKIPRRYFLPEELENFADRNQTVPLGPGAIVPDFSSTSLLLDHLELTPTSRLLVYGRGCGFFASIAATIAERVEVVELLDEKAAAYPDIWSDLGLENIALIEEPADTTDSGRRLYHAILVHGGTEQIPRSIFSTLSPGGRLIAPLADPTGNQVLTVFVKEEGAFSVRTAEEVFFPLGEPLFLPEPGS